MQLHTFKARSLADALRLVRDELGPDASVLHTREVGSPLIRLLGGRILEVTASAELAAPSRLPEMDLGERRSCRDEALPVPDGSDASPSQDCIPPAELVDYRRKIRQDVLAAIETEPSLVEQLAASPVASRHRRLPGVASIASRLRQAGVSDETIRRWLDRLEAERACDPEGHVDRRFDRLRQIIAAELAERILPCPIDS